MTRIIVLAIGVVAITSTASAEKPEPRIGQTVPPGQKSAVASDHSPAAAPWAPVGPIQSPVILAPIMAGRACAVFACLENRYQSQQKVKSDLYARGLLTACREEYWVPTFVAEHIPDGLGHLFLTITEVQISGDHWQGRGAIADLRCFPDLSELTLFNYEIDGPELQYLAELHNLRRLCVCQTPVGDECVPFITKMHSLRELRLVDNGTRNLSESGIEALRRSLPTVDFTHIRK